MWAVFGLYCAIGALRDRRVIPLLTHAPGGVLALIYMTHAGGAPKAYAATWGDRLWPFYSLSFLHSRTNTAETIWALVVLFVFLVLLAATRRRPDSLFWTAAACVVAGLFLPPYMKWEVDTHFAPRLAMFAFLLLLV